MIGLPRRAVGNRPLLVVHGHRDGDAVGGRAAISSECVARVRAAESAARRFGCGLVLFYGAGAAGHPSEARQMAAIWRRPAILGYLDERSTDTAENAREARGWFDALAPSALIVVSSWWHLRRLGYYGGPAFRGIPVRHVSTRRPEHALGHLGHELRYAVSVWRLRKATARSGPVVPTTQHALVLPSPTTGSRLAR